jgi:Holliday junction resolvase RusA-like endonuclease
MARASWRTEFPPSASHTDCGFGVRLVLPIVPPSANELKKYRGRYIASNIRKAMGQLIGDLLISDLKHVKGLVGQESKRRVQYVVYRARKLDEDNVYAGLKPVTDALRDVGLLKDDSPKWASIPPPVQVARCLKDWRRTEVLIQG